ncbi:PRELI domain-containing protein 1, mitochondrial-like isoform X2 [Scyliorhinus torazame]|uniref:PRELI domain-containing protein 1, mitochondrial-like isoform X2 n=1 Tax=Scyliorhinus torazame TaxID=75743 RepID=UPI003B59154D
MMKYFLGLNDLKSSWDQVFSAFWQRYPNPYSKHVLTEDVIHREVTPDKVISRRLLTKTGIVPRWAERLFPTHVAHSAFVLEDSVVDLKHKTLTTFTWNINHARLMVVREWCEYRIHPENKNWTQIKREAWISSNLYGFSLAIQIVEVTDLDRHRHDGLKSLFCAADLYDPRRYCQRSLVHCYCVFMADRVSIKQAA